jgi:hypothetical protein
MKWFLVKFLIAEVKIENLFNATNAGRRQVGLAGGITIFSPSPALLQQEYSDSRGL